MPSHATRLIWEGSETLHHAAELIRQRSDVELQLPSELHFALFTHFYPTEERTQPDAIDVSGGTEILEKVAEVRGLEQIRELIEPTAHAGAEVQVVSPSPTIFIRFGDPAHG